MSFSTGRVKLNIYYMPNKIKICLAPKEKGKKERKLLLQAEIPLLHREAGPFERKTF